MYIYLNQSILQMKDKDKKALEKNKLLKIIQVILIQNVNKKAI